VSIIGTANIVLVFPPCILSHILFRYIVVMRFSGPLPCPSFIVASLITARHGVLGYPSGTVHEPIKVDSKIAPNKPSKGRRIFRDTVFQASSQSSSRSRRTYIRSSIRFHSSFHLAVFLTSLYTPYFPFTESSSWRSISLHIGSREGTFTSHRTHVLERHILLPMI